MYVLFFLFLSSHTYTEGKKEKKLVCIANKEDMLPFLKILTKYKLPI